MNTKYCKAQLTAPQSIFVFTFFRQQITESALGWGVLKLEVSLCEVSSLFQGKSLCRAPHWACLSPLPLLTSCSNLRTQGSQNLCWEPRLNTQLHILLTVANHVPSEAQRPETTPEEKAVQTPGSLLCLLLFGIWHQLFDFLPVPWDCQLSFSSLLAFCSWCKCHSGAGEGARRLKLLV